MNVDASEITAMRITLERLEEELQQEVLPPPEPGPTVPEAEAASQPEQVQEPEPEPEPEQEPVQEPGQEAEPTEVEVPSAAALDRREVVNLLEEAEFSYQHERYALAREKLEKILASDPENPDAQNLLRAVERAIALSEQIASEEARTREAMAAPPPQAAPAPPQNSDVEVWGSPVKPLDTMGFDTLPDQQGPMAAPKPKTVSRVIPHLTGLGRVLKPVGLVLLVAVIVAGAYFLLRAITSTVVPTQTTMLVLPAGATGGSPSLTQFAEGFTDDVIRKLGMVVDLRVIASTSASSAFIASMNPPQAARAVNAGFCLSWNFTRDSAGYRLQQSLYDSSSSIPVWSRTVDIPASQISVERSEILGSLLKATGVHASEEELVALHKIPTPRSDAFDAFLRGRAILLHPEVEPISSAIRELEHAVTLDSLFGEAYALLGWANVRAIESGDTSMAKLDEARICVQRAVELGFRNAEAFRTWGAIERRDGDLAKAEERFDQAVQIAPSDAEACRGLAVVQVMRGEVDRALPSAQRGLKVDPFNINSYILFGLLQEYAAIANNDNKDDYTSALATLKEGEKFAKDRSAYASKYLAGINWYLQNPDESIAILSDHMARTRQDYESLYLLGRVQQAAGRPIQEWQSILARSKALLQDELRGSPNNPVLLSWLALAETRLGEFKDAAAVSQRALQYGGQAAPVLYNVARMYALQKNPSEAVTYLRKAVDADFDLVAVIDMDFFNLHGSPEYLKAATR